MSDLEDAYHLGTSHDELSRLGYQHQLWQAETAALWRQAGFGRGQRLLDLGCGPGYTSLEMARLVGKQGSVAALDASARFVRHLEMQRDAAGLRNLDTYVADIGEMPELGPAFDGIFIRWVLCFVLDPAGVIRKAFELLKPGGAFVVVDYFNYKAVGAFPKDAGIQMLFDAYYESAIHNNGSYEIGDRIPSMSESAGFEIESISPICHTARPGSRYWQWIESFNDNYIPRLVEQGLATPGEADEMRKGWQRTAETPGAFIFTPPVLAMVARRPA